MSSRADWKKKLTVFYTKYNKKMIDKIDNLLAANAGEEESMFEALVQKYTRSFFSSPPVFDPEEHIHPDITKGMCKLYMEKIRPVEEYFLFNKFQAPLMSKSDFSAKPMVLLLGQYSVGKTTFIKYFLKRDFPGIRIGPEPTTDKFVVIMDGPDERLIPGNALAVQADKPFRPLAKFGNAFLNRFECAQVPCPLTKKITLVDSPGVLAGDKQRLNRGYNFTKVIEWFASKVDRILCLFDAHKLDVSDEFKQAILALRGHDEKIRVVLNKADRVSSQQLMRVYGAMMWSLGKVVNTPEVLRVYISSFWDKPYDSAGAKFKDLFDNEKSDLLADLRSIPRGATVRKLNELVKRARAVKVHAFIISEIKERVNVMWGVRSAMDKVLSDLPGVFMAVMKKHQLVKGDFPDWRHFKERLEAQDDWKKNFHRIKPKMLEDMDTVLSRSLPLLMKQLPSMNTKAIGLNGPMDDELRPASNPFTNHLEDTSSWIIDHAYKNKADAMFYSLPGAEADDGGRVSGQHCVSPLQAHAKGNDVDLHKIWELADGKNHGALNHEEFAVALYLIDMCLSGEKLPEKLPENLLPPSYRS
eukprot:g5548.t1